MKQIANFLDEDGKIKAWPAKKQAKLCVLLYISSKFEYEKDYTEKEVNEIIEKWHTFGDYFLIRREMIDYRVMCRTRNGSKYWREKLAGTDIDTNCNSVN